MCASTISQSTLQNIKTIIALNKKGQNKGIRTKKIVRYKYWRNKFTITIFIM